MPLGRQSKGDPNKEMFFPGPDGHIFRVRYHEFDGTAGTLQEFALKDGIYHPVAEYEERFKPDEPFIERK